MAFFHTLQDNFNDNSRDVSLWDLYVEGAAAVSEINGRVEVSLPASATGDHGAGYVSQSNYDLSGSSVVIEVPLSATAGGSLTMVSLENSESVIAFIQRGSLLELQAITVVGETLPDYYVSSFTYNAVNHRWWRIRQSSGVIYFDTSANGATWTNKGSTAFVTSVTSLKVAFNAYNSTEPGTPLQAWFDNFNSARTTRDEVSSASGGGSGVLFYESAEVDADSSASGGGNGTFLTAYQPLPDKEYECRIFDHDWNFVGIWKDVTSNFEYSQTINQAPTEMKIHIGRSPDNRALIIDSLLDSLGAEIFDENGSVIQLQTSTANAIGPDTDVQENYNVDIYAFYGGYDPLQDTNGNNILDESSNVILAQYGAPNGKRVYSGYIVDLELTYGSQTGVDVTIVPHATEMSHYVYKDATDHTTITHNSTDPVAMARSAMDNYNDQGGLITYTTSSMPLSGEVSSYQFKLQPTREVIDKSVDLLPAGFYHYVDPGENTQYLKQKGSTADHTFYLGKHITELRVKKSLSQLENDGYLVGGDTGSGDLYVHIEETTSKNTIRPGLFILADSRVTLQSSAELLLNRQIAEYSMPRYRSSITITDAVYDIETIKPGHMVAIKNVGTFVDDLLLQAVTLSKRKHSVTLELDTTLPSDAKRLEDIKRSLLSEQVRDIPTIPS